MDPAAAEREARRRVSRDRGAGRGRRRTGGSATITEVEDEARRSDTARTPKATARRKAASATAVDPPWIVTPPSSTRSPRSRARAPGASAARTSSSRTSTRSCSRRATAWTSRRRRSASSSRTSPGSRRRCCRTSPTGRSTSSASRTAPARPASGRRTSRRPRRSGSRSGTRPGSASARTGRRTTTSIADRAATLCWLGNQAAFEVHAWTSTTDDPWTPTFALIDIDPGTKTTWDETLVLARLYRTALEHLGVRGYPKTTGSRGIQAWIPIERGRYTYAETSAWVEKLSRAIGATVPDLVSWEWAKAARGGKARLDYTQNAAIKTLVAPYAVRPATGRPGLRADPLGGAGRPDARPGPLDDPRPRRARRRGRRPVRRRADRPPGAARPRQAGITRNDGAGLGRFACGAVAARMRASVAPRRGRHRPAGAVPHGFERDLAGRRPASYPGAASRPLPTGGCAMRTPILLAAVALAAAACGGSASSSAGRQRYAPPDHHGLDAGAVRGRALRGAPRRHALRRRHVRGPGRQPVRAHRARPRVHLRAGRGHGLVHDRPAVRGATATCPTPRPSASRSSSTRSPTTTRRRGEGTFALVRGRRPDAVPRRATRSSSGSASRRREVSRPGPPRRDASRS